MENYNPPFEITNDMLDKVACIMEKIGRLGNYSNLNKMPYLRKSNQINSIHSSLAIENNILSIEQVKDVINGNRVLGSQREIQEVKNAFKAYEMIKEINPYSIADLKKVHGIMGYLTVDDAGKFRKGAEGVFDGDKCIFVCPPEEQVTPLMNDLFIWMKKNRNKINPLILSSVFHYEFVFIHPFSDGNGRMARLWQNILLYNWKYIFEYLPIETNIHKYQDEYYKAISKCHAEGKANVFIEFMLKMIDKTLDEIIETSDNTIIQENVFITKLIKVMKKGKPMSATEIMERLEIKSKKTFRTTYMAPALVKGYVHMTLPDKPTSKYQMYYRD